MRCLGHEDPHESHGPWCVVVCVSLCVSEDTGIFRVSAKKYYVKFVTDQFLPKRG